jgi:hypothetical protein
LPTGEQVGSGEGCETPTVAGSASSRKLKAVPEESVPDLIRLVSNRFQFELDFDFNFNSILQSYVKSVEQISQPASS